MPEFAELAHIKLYRSVESGLSCFELMSVVSAATNLDDERDTMRNRFAKFALAGLLTTAALTASEAYAGRTQADLLRIQVVRVHARLSREALDSPEIAEAHAASSRAYAALYQIRENILVDLRKSDDYADLKLALWHQQQMLQGQHLEVPVRVTNILATAGDSLSIRTRLGKMENDALEASEAYVAARDELNTLVAAERQVTADALDRVRNDSEFVSLSQQLHSAQGAYSHRGTRH